MYLRKSFTLSVTVSKPKRSKALTLISEAQLALQADAGALFKVDLPWVGLPKPVFGSA
jgi:hypothetical protein